LKVARGLFLVTFDPLNVRNLQFKGDWSLPEIGSNPEVNQISQFNPVLIPDTHGILITRLFIKRS